MTSLSFPGNAKTKFVEIFFSIKYKLKLKIFQGIVGERFPAQIIQAP